MRKDRKEVPGGGGGGVLIMLLIHMSLFYLLRLRRSGQVPVATPVVAENYI